jgi:GWxTD domain-containing protein
MVKYFYSFVKNIFHSIFIFILSTLTVQSQGINYRYIRLALTEHCKTIITPQADGHEVFVKINFGEATGFHEFMRLNSNLMLVWSIKNTPEEAIVFADSVDLTIQNCKIENNYIECKFHTPLLPADKAQFLTLKFFHPESKQTYVMYDRITNTSDYTFPFFPKKKEHTFPLFDQYCYPNDTLEIQSGTNDSITVQYIHTTDSLALPPMYVGNNPYVVSKSTQHFKLAPNTKWTPIQTGLYTFSNPGHSSEFSIVVLQHKFPTFTKVKELISALQYLTTNDEQTTLLAATKQKEALDDFLISLTGDKNLAKNIIKNYFKRVTEANKLFTTTKEGWKTDKGMIYIIFGQPDKVYYENGHEDWSYEKNPLYNELNFYFQHKNTPEGYIFELERLKDYQEIWIAIIEKWRRGLIK